MTAVLIGAVEMSLIAIKSIIKSDIKLLCICTLPKSKIGRHSDYVDLGCVADQKKICCIETDNINCARFLNKLKKFKFDYLFIIGWSQIAKDNILKLPEKGCIGFHPSDLPNNRGRAAIPWTIIQKRKTTGSTLFWIDQGVDTGDILIQKKFKINKRETSCTLYEKHKKRLSVMITEIAPFLIKGVQNRQKQNHKLATYCSKRTKNDGFISWKNGAEDVYNLIRAAGKPYHGAFTIYKNQTLTIWEADVQTENTYIGIPGQIQEVNEKQIIVTCGDGKNLKLKKMQLDSKDIQSPDDVFKNHERLGLSEYDLIMLNLK